MIPELFLVACLTPEPAERHQPQVPSPPPEPIVVLLDRNNYGASEQIATWLRDAWGPDRARIDAVTLVWATPAQVEAWTGVRVAANDRLVRLDAARRVVLGHAAFDLVPEHVDHGEEKGDPEITAWFDRMEGAWSQGLRSLLTDLPANAYRPTAVADITRLPSVEGAAICTPMQCGGATCDPSAASSAGGQCGMGYVTGPTLDFLRRWPHR